MFDRITGVPPTQAQIDQMVTLGDPIAAALQVAAEDPNFYNVTLKNFVTPWTNRDQTVFAPLNDYTATVIGMVRDNVPFNTALSADLLYTVNAPGIPAASPSSNDHYEQAETKGVNLKAALQATTQSAAYGTPAAGTAGLITTRAASAAFFIAGTNRAMFRFTMVNHMCRDMEQLHDTSRPPDRIRQDVARSPGGDSRIFLNNCIGCHSGMDPMAQAFAYYNYDDTAGKLVYTPGTVQPKYFINSDNFKPGFVTPNDNWENRWRHGQNSIYVFSQALPGSGAGAKSLGEEIANSDQFAQCQVEKVWKAVCFRAPSLNGVDRDAVGEIAGHFKTNGYKLKNVFAEVAARCE
ncbi:MAG: hypothetical protein WDO68_00420 [Gammaproteobacteria bacterium]